MQEKKSLHHIEDSFKKIVVTKNGLKLSRDEKGVVTMDIYEFLLNEDSLDYYADVQSNKTDKRCVYLNVMLTAE